jgi:hypothetical protein
MKHSHLQKEGLSGNRYNASRQPLLDTRTLLSNWLPIDEAFALAEGGAFRDQNRRQQTSVARHSQHYHRIHWQLTKHSHSLGERLSDNIYNASRQASQDTRSRSIELQQQRWKFHLPKTILLLIFERCAWIAAHPILVMICWTAGGGWTRTPSNRDCWYVCRSSANVGGKYRYS